MLGRPTCTFLWDFKNFFDSIHIPTLITAAEETGFPLMDLYLTLAAHLAPRRLRMGKAVGETVADLGRSMLAGCKRSTQMARAYTVRFVKHMAKKNSKVTLYQHVDDVSNLVQPDSEHQLAITAIEYAMGSKEKADRLHLTISDKTTVIPNNDTTRQICRVASRAGIPMRVAGSGVDTGFDSSSAASRTTAKQKERLREGGRRAGRAELVAKVDERAKILAMTSVGPVQVYGYIVVGASPSTRETCKWNIVEASGKRKTWFIVLLPR